MSFQNCMKKTWGMEKISKSNPIAKTHDKLTQIFLSSRSKYVFLYSFLDNKFQGQFFHMSLTFPFHLELLTDEKEKSWSKLSLFNDMFDKKCKTF